MPFTTPTVRLFASTTAAFGVASTVICTTAGGSGCFTGSGGGRLPSGTVVSNPGFTATSLPPLEAVTVPSVVWKLDVPCLVTFTMNAVPRTDAVLAGVRTSYFEPAVSECETTCQLRPTVCCIYMKMSQDVLV